MRGEYKVPGGKLVAVEVDVSDGRLSDVSISGDFFLEPDDALEDINAALTGLSTDAGVEQLASAIDGALDETVSSASRPRPSGSQCAGRWARPPDGTTTSSTSSRP